MVSIKPATNLITLDGLIITAGSTGGSGQHCGGLIVDDAPVSILNCRFSGNQSTGRGGALHLADNTNTVRNCLFTGNGTTARGGAVGTLSGNVSTFTNCAFLGNIAERGGAVNLNGGTATFTNATFSGNSGTINGGAIKAAAAAQLTLRSSVIWHNSDHNLLHSGGSLPAVRFSVVEGSPTNTTGFFACLDGTKPANDPDFLSAISPLSAPTTSGNFHIPFDSPVMSVGENSSAPLPSDLDENDRISGHTVDLGCYEVQLADSDSDGLSDTFECSMFNVQRWTLSVRRSAFILPPCPSAPAPSPSTPPPAP